MTHTRTSVVNVRTYHPTEPGVVYIGRPSKWGNPFLIGRDGDRATVIQKYAEYLGNDLELMSDLHELVGKRLACYCAPLPCHGDVLAEAAEAQEAMYEYLSEGSES